MRWSSGGLLASGGDDKLIMIWRLSGGSGGSSIFGSKAGVETWRCIATLRSHEGDVLDLAWAPHSPWLASASVDNSVIIWDASKFPAVVAVLKGHTGLVKGVTWDPVGKYLASQSDDKTLRVWRTTDWAEEALISEPFEECGGTTHVLRLSWSPDGQYLVSAHAMNGGGSTAQIIERDGWTTDKDFVGHRKAVTCVVRWYNLVLEKRLDRFLNSRYISEIQWKYSAKEDSGKYETSTVLLRRYRIQRSFSFRLVDFAEEAVGRGSRIIHSFGTRRELVSLRAEIGRLFLGRVRGFHRVYAAGAWAAARPHRAGIRVFRRINLSGRRIFSC